MKKAVVRTSWSLHQYAAGLFLIAALLLPARLFSQVAGTGTIQGIVSDTSGAVIPHAKVTLTETSTQVVRNTQTDGSGVYVLPNIAVGTYTVTVIGQGFETYVKTGVVLEIGSNISVNVPMTVGSQTEKVEVQADNIGLQTEDIAYKQTIDATELTELPLNGRQITGLLQFAGGTTSAGGGDFTGSKYSYQTISISIAGGQGNDTLWRLDGGDNSDYMAGGNLPFPFPDAVAQFSVESSALGAGSGQHAGGMVNVVTRSGANTFHGSAFEFIRNNLLDATNFFTAPCTPGAAIGSCGKDTLHFDQYGGTFGGPVRIPKVYNGKDKLFFFTAFQYQRSRSSTTASSAVVPTAANLAGNFQVQAGIPTSTPGSGVLAGTPPNPLCGSKLAQLLDPLTGNPVPGNAYATRPTWNPQSLALLKFLPPITPEADGSDICGRVNYTTPSANFDKQFITRIDYTINSNNHLYGRYMLDSYQNPAYFSPTNILLTGPSGNPEERVQTGTIGEDHTFTSNLVNSAHIAVLRRLNVRGYAPDDINGCNLGVNMTCAVSAGLFLGTGGNGGGFSIGGGTNSVSHFNDNTLAVNDDLTWLHGKHQFVFGGEFIRNQLNISNAFNSNGQFGFSANYSSYGPYGSQNQSALNGNFCATCSTQLSQVGDGALDFLSGTQNAFTQTKQQQNALRTMIPSVYAQDTFHLTKRLTIVGGIRWQPNFEPYDVFNRGEIFSPAAFLANTHSTIYPTAPAGMLFFGDQGVPRSFTRSSPNQWDPNLGVTYDPVGDGKTVFRAGAEYMYDLPNAFNAQRNQQNPPFATSVTQSLNSYVPFSNPWSAPTLAAGPGAVTASSTIGNPFPTGASFVGTPTPGCTTGVLPCAVFPKNSQYIVPVAQQHSAAYMQWTASIQHDFGAGWLLTLQYIGSKGDHEQWDSQLNGAVFIPGVATSATASPSSCSVSIDGVSYYLGEFAASSAAPALGQPCSTTGNETQRSKLILQNPAQGNLIGSVNASQLVSDIGISTYEGLVVSVNHRLSSSFSMFANYTWSKNLDEIDNNGDVFSPSGENPNNPRMEYGPSGADFRHVFSFAPILKSDFHFNGRMERLILNGWEVSALGKLTSGSNFSVTTGSDTDLIGGNGDRATRIEGVPLHTPVPVRRAAGAANRQYLNPAAFQTNGAFYSAWQATKGNPGTATAPVFGNTGRNAYTNPSLLFLDGQVSRIWKLHEHLNMTTRLEAYNVLNHPSFNGTNGTVTSGSFGQIGGTSNGARVFQGVLKFIF